MMTRAEMESFLTASFSEPERHFEHKVIWR